MLPKWGSCEKLAVLTSLEKVENANIRIRESLNIESLLLLKSYLSQRKQFIVVDEQSSKLYPFKWGVPKKSTLGRLLFILYINDLRNCTLVKPRLFADDTSLVHSADTIDNLSKLINQDMVNVSNWMQANRL